jgi:hypothetical protein
MGRTAGFNDHPIYKIPSRYPWCHRDSDGFTIDSLNDWFNAHASTSILARIQTEKRMLATDPSEAYLKQAYLGEIRGEAFFRGLTQAMPERADDIALLAEVERATAAYLFPYLVKPVGPEEVSAAHDAGQSRVSNMAIGSWSELVETILPIISGAIATFREAETHAPQHLREVYELFTAHEQALLDYLHAERDGQDGSSRLRAFLEQLVSVQDQTHSVITMETSND